MSLEGSGHPSRERGSIELETTWLETPRIGFGCSPTTATGSPRSLAEEIAGALAAGYRLFDCAEVYGSEHLLAERVSALPSETRSRVRIVGKLWNTNHRYEHAREAFAASRRRLYPATIDTYLIHSLEAWRYLGPLDRLANLSPSALAAEAIPRNAEGEVDRWDVSLEETWQALKTLRQAGEVRAIGICCTGADDLLRFRRAVGEWPQVVQAPRDPRRPQEELLRLCRDRRIELMAYSCFGSPSLLRHPEIARVAARIGGTPAQTLLCWNLERAQAALVASASQRHRVENLAATELSLSPGDSRALSLLDESAAGD